MAKAVSFGNLVDPEQERIERNRALAEALRGQSMEPLTTQVAPGGLAVPIGPMQGVAKLAQALSSGYISRNADKQQKDLTERKRTHGAADVQGIVEALRGKAAIPSFQTGGNEMGDEPVMQNPVPAQAPDQAKALALALKSENPMAQSMGGALMTSMMPKTPKWTASERPLGDGRVEKGFVDANAADPTTTFRPLGTAPVKNEFVNGTPVNPYTHTTPVPKQADAPNPRADLLMDDGTGNLVPNKALVGVKKDIAAAGKPVVSVDARNYNTQESEQSKVYGKEMGELRAKINQSGYDAPKKIAALDRMEALLTGIDGGAAAPAMADIASVAQSFGIKLDPKLGAKQAAEALAREMAGSLRQPGTGPMTDKDFDNFLKQIPDLSKTAEGRKQIMGTMRAAIERDQRAAQFSREYAKKNGGVIDDNFFDTLSGFYAQNPVVTPRLPATNARGRPLVLDQADAILNGGKK